MKVKSPEDQDPLKPDANDLETDAAGPQWRWTVPTPAPFGRADRAILDALQNSDGAWEGNAPQAFTRSQVQKWIEESRLTLEGNILKPGVSLGAGTHIELDLPPPLPMDLIPLDIPIEILFQDEHIAVINKPPGLTVHPSETQRENTLVHALLFHIRDLSGIGGALRPGIVHRIDKNTSGALVITKSDLAHKSLSEQFMVHSIERKYWALCYGSLKEKSLEFRVENKLDRSPSDRKKIAVTEEGRRAISHFKLLREFGQSGHAPFASWIQARLETGRTHQVRVHLTGLGHSIMGDPTYGTPTENHTKWKSLPREIRDLVAALPGQALHARTLAFNHPKTGERLNFEAAPPLVFANLLKALENFS